MSQLRHIAMSVPDPWMAAEFYHRVFGLEIVGEADSQLAEGVYLSDGVINLALLKYKSDAMAQGTGKDFVGLHHIGFWVDDVAAARARVEAAGGRWLMGEARPDSGDFYEVKFTDPNGIVFDLTHKGWGGAQRRPGAADNEAGPPSRFFAKFAARRARAKQAMADASGT